MSTFESQKSGEMGEPGVFKEVKPWKLLTNEEIEEEIEFYKAQIKHDKDRGHSPAYGEKQLKVHLQAKLVGTQQSIIERAGPELELWLEYCTEFLLKEDVGKLRSLLSDIKGLK